MSSALRTFARPAFARSLVATPVQRRTLITLKKVQYETSATSDSGGRNGHVTLNDTPPMEFDLSYPKELGGSGKGPNPEQFFAMGFAACWINQMQLLAKQQKKTIPEAAKVTCHVQLGQPDGKEGFGINVRLVTENIEDQALIDATEEACAYSRAMREGAKVTVERK